MSGVFLYMGRALLRYGLYISIAQNDIYVNSFTQYFIVNLLICIIIQNIVKFLIEF